MHHYLSQINNNSAMHTRDRIVIDIGTGPDISVLHFEPTNNYHQLFKSFYYFYVVTEYES